MKLLLLLAFVAFVHSSPVDECKFGESRWCSSLKIAKKCGAFSHCMGTVWTNEEVKKDTDDVCTFCENIIKDTRKFILDNKTQDEIKQYLYSACEVIPISEIADQCKEAVNSDMEEIYKMISSELNPQVICAALGICSGLEDKSQYMERTKSDQDLHHVKLLKSKAHVKATGDICVDCKAFLGDIQQEMTSQQTEAEVESMLKEQLCAAMGALKDECDTLVDQYVPELMTLLASQVDAADTCAAMGFCTGTGDQFLLAKMRLQKSPLYLAAANKIDGTEECSFCHTMVQEMQDFDRSKAVQTEVESFIKQELCANLGSLKSVCEQTVDEYGPVLFELLANEIDPDTVCKSLGLCTAEISADKDVMSAMRDAMPSSKQQVEGLHKVAASEQCVVCEFVMTELDGLLKDNKTEAELMSALEEVCSVMPDTIKTSCKDFVDQYGPVVIQLLVAELSPELVCTTLGLCSANGPSKAKPVLKSGEECVLCETVVQYVDSLLQDNATQQEIKSTLLKVCNFLPSSITGECDMFVETYLQMLIQLIANELTPEEVCTELGLCAKKIQTPPKKVAKTPLLGTTILGSNDECAICETIMTYVLSSLETNSTEQEVEAEMLKVCSILPSSIKMPCEDFVKQYAPAVYKLLIQELSPKEMCTELGLCTSNVIPMLQLVPIKAEKQPLLGLNECTYGPAYWCASEANADKCGARSHCDKHGWNLA